MPSLNHARDEQGSMAIEFLFVISMLMVVFLLMLQYAVKSHAERVATAAAHDGLAAASRYEGTANEGRRTATESLAAIGPGLAGSHVTASRSAVTATVTITGQVDQLVPLLSPTVRVRVEGPVERFVPGPAVATP